MKWSAPLGHGYPTAAIGASCPARMPLPSPRRLECSSGDGAWSTRAACPKDCEPGDRIHDVLQLRPDSRFERGGPLDAHALCVPSGSVYSTHPPGITRGGGERRKRMRGVKVQSLLARGPNGSKPSRLSPRPSRSARERRSNTRLVNVALQALRRKGGRRPIEVAVGEASEASTDSDACHRTAPVSGLVVPASPRSDVFRGTDSRTCCGRRDNVIAAATRVSLPPFTALGIRWRSGVPFQGPGLHTPRAVRLGGACPFTTRSVSPLPRRRRA
jgi:hypothetical protein